MRFLQMIIAIVVGALALTAALIGAIVLASMAVLASIRRRFSRTGISSDGIGRHQRGTQSSGSGEVIDIVAHEVAAEQAANATAERPLQPTHARAL